jgi:uncharacterized repeat protein (TIGR01451 family)
MKRTAITTILCLGLGAVGALALLWLFGSGSTVARAQGPDGYDTYYVAPGGDCGGETPCYAAVQAAVDAADDPGDVVKVAAGTYTDVHYRATLTQVVYISKTVTIRGGYTTTDWTASYPMTQATTLDAQRQGRVLYVSGNVNPTLEGLRITGGYPRFSTPGGGIYVDAAAITLKNCRIISNSVHFWGGGVYLSVWEHALLSGNTIVSNTAEYGGGLYASYSDVTLVGNTIASNTAVYNGAGVYLTNGDVTLTDNNIIANRTNGASGGLWIDGSNATLTNNHVSANIGVGVFVLDGSYTLISNTVSGNTANHFGGGLFVGGTGTTLAGNAIISNSTTASGGGLALVSSDAVLANNVIADNWASGQGSGLYIMSSCSLLHNTIARNGGGDGSGVHVNSEHIAVSLTNNIVVSHTVGITVTLNSTATLEATLWGSDDWANETDWGGDGTIITGTPANNHWGEPAFVDPENGDYHIGAGSAARDAGIDAGLGEDADGDPRPMGHGYDLGADEFKILLSVRKTAMPSLVQAGEQLTYTIRITNTGSITLTATITDILPVHVTTTQPVVWTSQAITAPGGIWEQTVVVTVDVGYTGLLTNVVHVTTEEGASGTYTETSATPMPALQVTKRASSDSVQAGEQLTYTIRVTNTGNVDLHATVTDVLPSHVTPTDTLTWTPTIAAPGGVWEQTVVVTVETGYSGALTNTVQVTTEEGAGGSDTATCTSVGGYYVYLPLVLRQYR